MVSRHSGRLKSCSNPFSDGLSVIIALCPHTASLHESRLPFSLPHPPAAFLRVAQNCRRNRHSCLLRSQTAPQSRRGQPQKMLSRAERQPAHRPTQMPFPTHGQADARIRPLLVCACGQTALVGALSRQTPSRRSPRRRRKSHHPLSALYRI